MSSSWRSDVAEYRNRWIVVLMVLLSILAHVGLIVFLWKSKAGMATPPKNQAPIYVDMVQADSLPVHDDVKKGSMVRTPVKPNEKRPLPTDKLSEKDHRAEQETYNKNQPFNEIGERAGNMGRQGRPGLPGKGPGNVKTPGPSKEPGKGSAGPRPPSTTKDLIGSVSYSNLKPSAAGGDEGTGGNNGHINPYNPKRGSPGNVVNLNTKSFKYMSYFSGIKDKIEWAWVYPQQAQRAGYQGVLTLTFTILRSGELKEVRLVSTSGYPILDRAAMQAVRDAASFGPMPSSWDDQELTILANFHYQLVGAKQVY